MTRPAPVHPGAGLLFANMNIVEHIFDSEGRLFRETKSRIEIQLTPEIARSMVTDMQHKVTNLARHPLGAVHLCADPAGYCYYTVDLKELPLRTAFTATDDVLTPQFDSDRDPVLALKWVPPADLRLRFFMRVYHHSLNRQQGDICYLFAFSEDNNAWHLPLGNLFDDCRICMGEERFTGPSQMDVLNSALSQFEKSEWNADLWRGDVRMATKRLFRFKASNEKMTQLPIEGAGWMAHCQKVGVELARLVVL